MAPKKRKTDASAPAAKKTKAAPKTAAPAAPAKKPKAAAANLRKRKAEAEAVQAPSAKKTKAPTEKPAGAKRKQIRPKNPKTDVAEVVRLATAAKKALEVRGEPKTVPKIAEEINENLDRPYNLKDLKQLISSKGLYEDTESKKKTYQYAGRSNPDLLSASADGIAFVVERDAKGQPTKIRDLVETYFDERNKQGVPFRSECFAVADNGDNVELTREAARASALAKLASRMYRGRPRHSDLIDDIEDEDFKEKVKAAREELLGRTEHVRVKYGTGDYANTRPGLSYLKTRVADGTEYVSFTVEPLKSEALTYVIRPGTAQC